MIAVLQQNIFKFNTKVSKTLFKIYKQGLLCQYKYQPI